MLHFTQFNWIKNQFCDILWYYYRYTIVFKYQIQRFSCIFNKTRVIINENGTDNVEIFLDSYFFTKGWGDNYIIDPVIQLSRTLGTITDSSIMKINWNNHLFPYSKKIQVLTLFNWLRDIYYNNKTVPYEPNV